MSKIIGRVKATAARFTAVLTIVGVGLMSGSTAVFAAPDPGAPKNNFDIGSYFSCANISFLEPIRPQIYLYSGIALGIGVLIMVFAVIGSGVKVGLAGDKPEKAKGGFMSLKHAMMGIGILMIVIPIILMVLAASSLFCHA